MGWYLRSDPLGLEKISDPVFKSQWRGCSSRCGKAILRARLASSWRSRRGRDRVD